MACKHKLFSLNVLRVLRALRGYDKNPLAEMCEQEQDYKRGWEHIPLKSNQPPDSEADFHIRFCEDNSVFTERHSASQIWLSPECLPGIPRGCRPPGIQTAR